MYTSQFTKPQNIITIIQKKQIKTKIDKSTLIITFWIFKSRLIVAS